MKRMILVLIAGLFLAGAAAAQYTTVSGIAVDLANTPFIYGNYTISLVNPNGGTALLQGNPFQQLYSGTLTATGALPSNHVLPSNNFITPGGTQWNFNICANPRQINGIF